MADSSPAATLLFLRDEELRHGLELLLAAERHLTAPAEALLAERGLGPVHGRLLMLVGRRPQMSVSSVLSQLRISKQTGSRLVADLVRAGHLLQRPGTRDRRQRELVLTEDGRRLERLLWERQRPRLVRAYRACGPEAVEGFRRVLLALGETAAERRLPERAAGAV